MNRSTEVPLGAEQILELGTTQSDTALNLQKDLLNAYAESGRAWLLRAQKEMELWSQLASRLAASRSVPETMAAYQESLSERMQLAVDDGQRLFKEFQELTSKIAYSASGPNGAVVGNPEKNPKKRRES